jgi:uncharacterized membrane protein YhaH (DUF805 family)
LGILREFLLSAAKIQENWGIRMSPFNLLFSFKGRIRRGQYWAGATMQIVAAIVILGGYFAAIGSIFPRDFVDSVDPGSKELAALAPLLLPILLVFIGLIWSTAALYTKRLHDRDKGAIWLLAIYGPIALIFVSPFFIVLAMISNIWNFIELGCLSGTNGPNRFDIGVSGTNLDDIFGKVNPSDARSNAKTAEPSLGGMAAAMAAMNAAARDNQNQVPAASRPTSAPQFGQRAPAQFGRLNAGATSGGFGRRGL